MAISVAVIGAGIAGMATAARLQAQGLSTVVFEAHGQAGGCAGFFRRRGFSFDVGATTLVDFEPGGVGGELLEQIGMAPPEGEALPGYAAWLPDRVVTLQRDQTAWQRERLRVLGNTLAHRRFWHWMDCLASVFWRASRSGAGLPISTAGDLFKAVRAIGWSNLGLVRYVRWTVGDALRSLGLREERPLVGLLSMLLEDTVHAGIDEAPLINGALGITIRGAGLTRARGGMYGFWRRFVAHYRSLGGILRVGCPVQRVEREAGGGFRLWTRRGEFFADRVVSALPVTLTDRLAPVEVCEALRPYLRRDADAQGGAVVVFLGVPESEVRDQEYTHHQLMHAYDGPLGNGNNMFISVSAENDDESAPPGHRAVMISTHCDLAKWEGLGSDEYQRRKEKLGTTLVSLARRVYPDLGRAALVWEVATPRTYERFTRRPRGAVGGFKQSLANANQRAVPHDVGVPGFWLAGDTTWPGLGTVACVLGSRLVAEKVMAAAKMPRSHDLRSHSSRAEPPLPRLDALGTDLLSTSRRQRWLACCRPFFWLGVYLFIAAMGWWWLAPLVVFLLFIAVVTVTHDVVHGSLGLGPRQTEWALFVMGALLLESGHAYRISHLQHHRRFPAPDDPEGDPARMSFWGAILHGPLFLPRLWWWAFSRARGAQRCWLLAEASWALAMPIAGILLWPVAPALLVYCLVVLIGSWSYPLLTVHLPHRNYGETPLTQTSTLRGRFIPALFLELTYHLEHHLYPGVPSHHLRKLSRRLDPFFRAAGVSTTPAP